MAVTIRQIAERAALSVPTVSRILNNDGEPFRQETRDAVFKAAQEMGYRPNSYRMALRTKKFNVVGLLFCSDVDRSALSKLTQFALLGELHKQNKHLLAGQFCGDKHDTKDLLPKMLREWSVDGVLIDTPAAISPEAEKWMKRTHVPAIYLNGRRECDCVHADEIGGACDGTERLLRLGHKRIMYLGLGMDKGQKADVESGYERAMKAAGLTPRSVVIENVPADARLAHLSEWIRAQPVKSMPTVILCGNVAVAMPLYVAARLAGLAVPRDLSILSIHDGMAEAIGVKMSVMCLPTDQLATAGLSTLDRKIASPLDTIAPVVLPLRYDEGVTVTKRHDA